ncbi:MAG: hypothetical protein IMZ53_12805 [Thermoplasmata archaeon]|nr:hypothetical protein [Thermoplasmata archaeon]
MELSPELIIYSERLKNFLKTSRERNQITPDKPISSVRIVEIAGRKEDKNGNPLQPIILTREDIYHLVHFLREQNEPIASGQRGYFYAIAPEDFDNMIMEQIRIIKERQETLTLAKKLKQNLFKATNSIFDTPTGQILKDNLELEPMNQTKENNGDSNRKAQEND